MFLLLISFFYECSGKRQSQIRPEVAFHLSLKLTGIDETACILHPTDNLALDDKKC